MPRRGSHRRTRPTAAQRAALVVSVALAVVAGVFSVTFSLAQVLARTDPAAAHGLAPYDGRIAADYATLLVGNDADEADRARADDLARGALRRDPMAANAVSALGVNAQIGGDAATARRLFTFAQGQSRRDLYTQLWAIEDAVDRGDIVGALRQYDITLRTKPRLGELLFPVLASASTDPAIRPGLIRTLSRRPPWGGDFINYVGDHLSDPQSTATLILALRGTGIVVPEKLHAGIVDALVAGGDLNDAWTYYAAIRPGADRHRSRDPRFTALHDMPSQFDWVATNDGGITATIERGVVDFTAPASVGGLVLRQMQMLPPGEYRLLGHSEGIEQNVADLPYWVLSCADGRELGRTVIPVSTRANGEFSGGFTVPAGCPIQTLALIARPSDAVSGLSGRITHVALVPTR